MKIPKTMNTYCPHCKGHHVHKVKAFKSSAPRTLSFGQRRHLRKHKSGYGGKAKFVIKVKKQTKKPTFVLECSNCKKKHYFVVSKRMKSEIKATE